MKFEIGQGVTCSLETLVNTRLLIQANSGAGKSWALRRLLEQTHGHVQQLVIDPEGEFASLRAKFDYVLAARTGGDTVADPRSAKLLAERLLELGVSAILDIYELKPHERVKFVRTFCEALVEAPKALWHPALVVLDEAHVYCPEQGDAESADAVKGLATRGRKRGFCLVLATQRLSKLHKDAAAECNNKLIGRSSLDVDMKRASDELGFTTKEQRLSLRDLRAGEFLAFGPALTHTVTKVKVGAVVTEHPKAGSHLAGVVPPPTEKVRAVLSKLADLPAEAEAREKSLEDLKRDNAQLRRELTLAQKAMTTPIPAPPPARIEVPVLTADERIAFGKAFNDWEEVGAAIARLGGLRQAIDTILQRVSAPALVPVPFAPSTWAHTPSTGSPRVPRPPARVNGSSGDLSAPEKRILDGLAWWETAGITQPSRHQVAFASRYSVNGHFNNTVGGMKAKGFIDYPKGDHIQLTEMGRMNASYPDAPATRPALIAMVDTVLRKEPLRRVFQAVAAGGGGELSRDDLASACGYSVNGHFNNTVGALKSLGVIRYPRGNHVALGEMFNAL